MSLKSFHIVFIAVSTALCLFLAFWGIREYRLSSNGQSLGIAVVGVAGLVCLIPYYLWVQKKFRKLTLAILVGLPACLLNVSSAWSCAVCFGDPNSEMTKGIKAGIILLMLVVGGVLGGIATIGFTWAKKARRQIGPL